MSFIGMVVNRDGSKLLSASLIPIRCRRRDGPARRRRRIMKTRQQILQEFLSKAAQVRESGYAFSFNESRSCLKPLIDLLRADVIAKNLKATRFDEVRRALERKSPKDSPKYRTILDRVRAEWPLFSDKQSAFLAPLRKVSDALAEIMAPDAAYKHATHSKIRLGLGTKFTLTAKILAPNVTAADVGGLRWTVTSGAHEVTHNDNTGTIVAVATEVGIGKLKFKLATVHEVFKKHTETGSDLVLIPALSIPVVAPTGATAKKTNGYRLGDVNTELSAYMDLDYFLTPDDVSFVGLQWREPGGEAADLTGTLGTNVRAWVNAENTAQRTRAVLTHGGNPNAWKDIEKESGGQPNRIAQTDKVGNTFGKDCSPGTFTWTIKWDYRMKAHDGVLEGRAVTFKTNVNHSLTVTGSKAAGGNVTIRKLNESHPEAFSPSR